LTDDNFSSPQVLQSDLGWNQVQETVLLLNLAVAQITGTLNEGDESVNALTGSLTSMMGDISTLQATLKDVEQSAAQESMQGSCDAISAQMNKAVVAFQFYDKLTQRLNHLNGSLMGLAALMDAPERLHNPDAWRGLQQQIKSRYTVDEDSAIFDAILQGKSVDEALRAAAEAQHSPKDDVELF